MKEATGELNMTIVVVIAVATLAAFFYLTLWPIISNNFGRNVNCAKAICVCDSECKSTGRGKCHLDGKKSSSDYFRCPWKG